MNLERLGRSYAKAKGYEEWAKRCVGHWNFSAFFHHEEKGNWSYGLFDLLTGRAAGTNYSMYSNRQTGLTAVQVYGKDGWLVKEQRYNRRKYRNYYWPSEVNFAQGRYACMVNNAEHGYLDQDGLLLRAQSLQLEVAGGYVGSAAAP